MNGCLNFFDNNCQFYFDGTFLKIYSNDSKVASIFTDEIVPGMVIPNRKPLQSNKIEGYSYDDKCNIVFYTNVKNYCYSSGIDGSNIILKIQVLKYIMKKSSIITTNDNTLISFGSNQFGNFLKLIPHYELGNTPKSSELVKISVLSSVYEQKKLFEIGFYNCEIEPAYTLNVPYDSMTFIPFLKLKVESQLDENEVLSFVDCMIRIFQFMHMRANVIPEKIICRMANYEYDIIIVKGIHYIEETKYKNDIFSPKCITWSSIYNYFDKIYTDFKDELVHLEFLDQELKSRKHVSFEKISKDGAFFEYTFHLIYGDSIEHKTATKVINDEIKAGLEQLKNGAKRKKRDTIDYLIKQLDHVALSNKMQKAFKEYKDCISLIREKLGLDKETNTKIADTCANARNWIDHGDKKASIDEYIAKCFILLRSVTYSMYLRRWGLSSEVIAVQLLNLYDIHL